MRKLKIILLSYFVYLLTAPALFASSVAMGTWNWAVTSGKDNANFILSFFSADNFMKLFMAILVIILTFFFSKVISGKIVSYIERNATEETSREELTGVISRTVSVTVLLIGFSITLGILWIDMWIFMGWIWFGIGFTLKTFLTNFVAGIMMVTQGYYHNWDMIKVDDQIGKIRKVNALFTAVEQFDGVVFYVPNIHFIEDKVTNYHTNDKRRIDIEVLIDYTADVHKAKKTIQMVMDQFPNILQAPASDVIVDDLSDNGILLKARYWTTMSDNYFHTKSNISETINMALKRQEIEIAYPHMNITHTNLPPKM